MKTTKNDYTTVVLCYVIANLVWAPLFTATKLTDPMQLQLFQRQKLQPRETLDGRLQDERAEFLVEWVHIQGDSLLHVGVNAAILAQRSDDDHFHEFFHL